MRKLFYDTETCGKHGPIVLIQYAWEDGPINLHNVWYSPIKSTLALIEEMMTGCTIGFNLAFDHFHLCQLYTTLALMDDKDADPIDCINEYALNEKRARDAAYTLKPVGCFDLMLHARKTEHQAMMDRDDIVIKRIPTVLADLLCEELNKRIQFKDIYFARKSDPKKRWQVMDVKDDAGDVIREFKNVVLKFAPSSSLKALAADKLGYEEVVTFKDIELPENAWPEELGFAPYAMAPYIPPDKGLPVFPSPSYWYGKWPQYIRIHANHWQFNDEARKYAYNDVKYTRELFYAFNIQDNQLSDNDSILACMVGSIRWRGYRVDLDMLRELKKKAQDDYKNQTINFNSGEVVKRYLFEVLSPTERAAMTVDGKTSTKAVILEEIAKWKVSDICPACEGLGCSVCNDGLIMTDTPHPAAERASNILRCRHAKKREDLIDKFLWADRFHASLVIIGARSGRSAGTDDLNAQGINHEKTFRKCFPLAWKDQNLTGGDLTGSQVAIAAAVFKDPKMNEYLRTKRECPFCKGVGCKECNGRGWSYMKIYAIFGQYLFPGMDYDAIYSTKGRGGDEDKYDRSKKGFLAMIFGGEDYTLQNRVGISKEAANEGFHMFLKEFPTWAKERKTYIDMFCSMTQPGGIGTEVKWKDPCDYIESMFGFRRYFTLENKVVKALFELATEPPKEWTKYKVKVVRRDREQTASGALRSALYAAAFALQAANMRAAVNHIIQSPETTIIKDIERRIWDLQPTGIANWVTMPLNIHDEIMNPADPDYANQIHEIVQERIAYYQKYIPLIDIEWHAKMNSWAEK